MGTEKSNILRTFCRTGDGSSLHLSEGYDEIGIDMVGSFASITPEDARELGRWLIAAADQIDARSIEEASDG